jgi:hypothetical protein
MLLDDYAFVLIAESPPAVHAAITGFLETCTSKVAKLASTEYGWIHVLRVDCDTWRSRSRND